METQRSKQRMVDSIFAVGKNMAAAKPPPEIESADFSGRAFEILQHLNEAEAMTVNAMMILVGCNRKTVQESITSLWYAGLSKYVAVATELGMFKLWMTSEARQPKTPAEACRMAALGYFYALAKKEVPGFEWRLVRKKNTEVYAEMSVAKNGTEKRIVIIDAPRRGEKAMNTGQMNVEQISIFPSLMDIPQDFKNDFTTDMELVKLDGRTLKEKVRRKITDREVS
ncbi:MAG: hypothetical protein K6U74_04500 [Firmicutes bacterium]|nr:hypothetical protein [Bacillota bacterium]